MAEMHTVIPVHVSPLQVEKTLDFLRKVGVDRNSEGVVLWLGKRREGRIVILESFIPEQIASSDYFRIPPAGMASLLRHLGNTRTFVAAQVHSHPKVAFHSLADDRWAIVRHYGALSLVVPRFARATTVADFLATTAVYALSRDDTWEAVPPSELTRALVFE